MTVALVVLGELVARGVPSDTAAGAVLALTRRGAGDEELVAFQTGFERGLRVGAAPTPRSEALGAGVDLEDASGGNNVFGSGGPRGGTATPAAGKPKTKPPRPCRDSWLRIAGEGRRKRGELKRCCVLLVA